MERVLIGVCTFQRPVMLSRCLESLSAQSQPDDLAVSIVVVDNELEPNNRVTVEKFAAQSRVPVHYVHQPQRGISIGRNAILAKATELGADWIAMLDDDETAAPGWLETLMSPTRRDTPVLAGRQVFVYPNPMPFWAKEKKARPSRERESDSYDLESAATNNVRFSIRLVEAGLRFDEHLGLAGGEDTKFFSQARALGFSIQREERAITYETAHPDRYTLSGQVYRAYWWSVAETRRTLSLGPKARVVLTSACRILVIGLGGVVVLLASPAFALRSVDRAKRIFVSGAKKMGRAIGIAAGLAGLTPQPYRRISGY